MIVNDDATFLFYSGALAFIASKLAPTVICVYLRCDESPDPWFPA
jgi:hypothetical protein